LLNLLPTHFGVTLIDFSVHILLNIFKLVLVLNQFKYYKRYRKNFNIESIHKLD